MSQPEKPAESSEQDHGWISIGELCVIIGFFICGLALIVGGSSVSDTAHTDREALANAFTWIIVAMLGTVIAISGVLVSLPFNWREESSTDHEQPRS